MPIAKRYQLARTLRTIKGTLGEPDEIDPTGDVIMWYWGNSRLVIKKLSETTCLVSRHRRGIDELWGVMDVAGSSRQYTIPALITYHLTYAKGRLLLNLYLASLRDQIVYAVHDGVVKRLPLSIQPLAFACMRHELPRELMLDVIKHDTNILG